MSETSTPKKSILKRWWFWLIVLIVIVVAVSSGNKSDNQTATATPEQPTQKVSQPAAPKTEEPGMKITATKLYSDYKANEIAADTSYKGKTLEITGAVNEIKKDITNTMYVTLKGDQYFGDVQCYFNDKYTSQLANLKKGQQLTVKGKCDGLMMNVLIKNCEIIIK